MSSDGIGQTIELYTRAPLLPRDQVLHLARLVQQGQADDATPRQQRAGLRARDQLIRANLRLVIHVAKRYRSRAPMCGLDLDDLVQEGCIGLARGVERFDPERGYRLSTFCTWWITQAITRRLELGGLVHRPAHVANVQAHLSRLPAGLTDEDAAAAIGATASQVHNARRPTLQKPTSLSAPLRAGSEEHSTLADTIAAPTGEDQLLQLDLADAVARLRQAEPDAVAALELAVVDGALLRDLAPLLGVQTTRSAGNRMARMKVQLAALVPEAQALLEAA